MALDEKRQKDTCRCETLSCSSHPLSHFEECPTCGSTAYHITVKAFEEEKEDEE